MADPYVSEVKYLGGKNVDFIEIVVDEGYDVSNIEVAVYNANGAVRSTNLLGTKVTTIAGKDVYIIDTATSATFNGLHKFGGVALVDDGVVLSFDSFSDNAATITATEGPANGLTSTDIGQAGAGSSLETADGGASYDVQPTPTPGSVPCFLKGTKIHTPQGWRPIDDLAVGDSVTTRDHGQQNIRWIGSKKISRQDEIATELQPVKIVANCFGKGRPFEDLYVSPNHRILIESHLCALWFVTHQVFSAAKYLVDGKGISAAPPDFLVVYYHLLFDQHEVIFSNGLASESFHPGQVGLDAFGAEVRAEILTLFPELGDRGQSFGKMAHRDLRKFEAGLLKGRVGNPTPTGVKATEGIC